MKKIMYLILASCFLFCACSDDDNGGVKGKNAMRIKRVVGENAIWGKYEISFYYRADGKFTHAYCLNKGENILDTLASFSVEYDLDYFEFKINDYVVNIDADSVYKLQQLYPDSYRDTLQLRTTKRVRYSSLWEDERLKIQHNRPRKDVGGGNSFNTNYVNVSSQTQIPEYNKYGLLVVRCYNDVFYNGAGNAEYDRTVSKYEFVYEGADVVACGLYKPDSYNDASWSKLEDIALGYYDGVLTSVDSEDYKMRRSSNQVVVAEPGKNTTYVLNEYGLAVKMESTDGDYATIEYESGSGNFAELYATPLDRFIGKVWIQ